MPLLNAELKYNQAIKQDQITMQQAEIQVYKRELVRDIKLAYINYLKATNMKLGLLVNFGTYPKVGITRLAL